VTVLRLALLFATLLHAAAAYGVDVPWPVQYLAARPASRKG